MRKGTAAEFAAGDPILAEGEFSLETDTGIVKVGMGKKHYSELMILGSGGSEVNPNKTATDIIKLRDYLFEARYNDIDYTRAYEYFREEPQIEPSGCSSFKAGNYYCRNLDWIYNEQAEFIVKVPHRNGLAASIAITGSLPELTNEFVTSGADSPLYSILPFRIVDGMNEYGLVMSQNVVPKDKGENVAEPTGSVDLEISGSMLTRYVLDHFKTADEAILFLEKHARIYCPKSIHDAGYELHFMIADKTKTYCLEIIENTLVDIDISNKPIMTNFYLDGVTFNPDGGVYTPGTMTDEYDAFKTNGITKRGAGLERYNLINQELSGVTTLKQARDLLEAIKYSNAYRPETNPYWYGEFVDGDYCVDTPAAVYEEIVPMYQYAFEHRTRTPGEPTYGTWHTVHSIIYEMDADKAYLVVQEDDKQEFEILNDGQEQCYVHISGQPAGTDATFEILGGGTRSLKQCYNLFKANKIIGGYVEDITSRGASLEPIALCYLGDSKVKFLLQSGMGIITKDGEYSWEPITSD